ncbi:MAG: hypothetical protein KBT06_00755, partial [Prevotellaceae bacterium]|nr:hypothetical protein [Candidatus Colivivens equi]
TYKSIHTGAVIDDAVSAVKNATAGGGTLLTSTDSYTKAEVNEIRNSLQEVIGQKANSSDVYNKSETYNRTEIDRALSGKETLLIPGTNITIDRSNPDAPVINGTAITVITTVSSLPLTDQNPQTLYLVARTSGSSQYMYDKYVWVNNDWEKINNMPEIDLSAYALKADVNAGLAAKQDKLVAGHNITIDPDTGEISASGDVQTEGEITPGHIIEGGTDSGDIKDSGIKTDSIKIVKMGVTSNAYVRLEDIPGLKPGNKIKVHVTGTNSNCHIKAVAYPGKNICNIEACNYENMVSNLLNARDTYIDLQAGAYYYAPSKNGSGFAYGTSLSTVSSNAYKATIQANHKYLLIAKFTCVPRLDIAQKALAPSLMGLYNNTTAISGTATPTADSANTDTSKIFYAFVTPTWAVAQNAQTHIMNSDLITTGLSIIQDGSSTSAVGYTYTEDTAVVDAASFASELSAKGALFTLDSTTNKYTSATTYAAGTTYYYRTADGTTDTLDEFVVIDVTEAGDDAFSLNTTTAIITEANVYARYKPSLDTLAAGTAVTSGKALGPYGNSKRQYIRAYYRQLYAKVPAGYRLYIREYKGVTSTGVPSGYIKTICVNATSATNTAIVLDQAVTLNAACLEFLVSTTSNTVITNLTGLQYMLMYYVTGKENTDFVPYQLPINIKTGGNMPYTEAFNNTTCVLYGSGSGEAEYEVSISSSSDYITGSISFIAENSSYLPVFAENVTDTSDSKTYLQYFVDSVNDAIVALQNQVAKLGQSSVLTTLPTAKGTYKYEVSTEGVPGTWTKEEETVVTLDTKIEQNSHGTFSYADQQLLLSLQKQGILFKKEFIIS